MKKNNHEDGKQSASGNQDTAGIPPAKTITRAGWEKDSSSIARLGEDVLVLGDFPNLDDKDLKWSAP